MDKKHLWCIRYVSVWKTGGIGGAVGAFCYGVGVSDQQSVK